MRQCGLWGQVHLGLQKYLSSKCFHYHSHKMNRGHQQSNCQHSQLLNWSPSKMMFWFYLISRMTFIQQWIFSHVAFLIEVQL